jgi:S1-C subfamily serine protease
MRGYKYSKSGFGLSETDDWGYGTCVVWRDEWVVTARHVVRSTPDDLIIVDATGTFLEPDKLIKDPAADIAVLHVPGLKSPAVGLSRARRQVGQTIFAAGLARGYSVSMSVGVITALHLMSLEGLDDSIQVDAQLNPGNSGGGVFDTRGDLVALANESLSKADRTAGISWAIDLPIVEFSANTMIDKGAVKYAELEGDIAFHNCRTTPKQLERFKLTGGPTCVVITDSDTAPLAIGDQVLEVRGVPVEALPHMKRLIHLGEPGKPVPMLVSRMGERMNLEVPTKQPERRADQRAE